MKSTNTYFESRFSYTLLAQEWRGVYDKAAGCLWDDLERMLTFYEFPEEHWRHVRTTNPIESPFAAIRLAHECDETIADGAQWRASALPVIATTRREMATTESSRKVTRGKNARLVSVAGGFVIVL